MTISTKLLLFATLGASSLGVAADSVLCALTAVKAEHPFTLDGQFVEQAYVQAEWSRPFTVMDREDPQVNGRYLPPEARFAALKTRVAAFTDGKDLVLTALAPVDASQVAGAGDSVEFHLSANDRDYFVVRVFAAGTVETRRYTVRDQTERSWMTKAVAAVKNGGAAGYVVETRIPLAELGASAFKGKFLLGNFVRRGRSCGDVSSWAPTNRARIELSKFGKIYLGETAAAPRAPLPEHRGKKIFFWGNNPWLDTRPESAAPVDGPELAALTLEGPRGARALTALRVSNLTSAPLMYNVEVEGADAELVKRIRLREAAYIELRGGEVLPDPIFELPMGAMLRIPARSTAVLWIDADFSGLAAGRFETTLKFVNSYGAPEIRTLPLAVRIGAADVSEIKLPVYSYLSAHRCEAAPLCRDYGFNVFTAVPDWDWEYSENGEMDFSFIDWKIKTYVEAGVPKDELRFMLTESFPRWVSCGLPKRLGRGLTFESPEYQRTYRLRLTAFIRHLKEKHGIGYDRLWLYPRDEPQGNPDDPKTAAYWAFKGAEFVRSIDPNLKLATNPWADEPQYLDRYFKAFDVLIPYTRRLMDGGEARSTADRYRDSGREIWSYLIYVKQNTCHQFRRGFWSNLNYGFEGVVAVYSLLDKTGDPYNSYDSPPKEPNFFTDYNHAYRNARTGQVVPSRRLEAWYQGLVDFRLVKWCRRRVAARKAAGEDVSAVERQIAELILAADRPKSDLDAARQKLLAISQKLGANPRKK